MQSSGGLLYLGPDNYETFLQRFPESLDRCWRSFVIDCVICYTSVEGKTEQILAAKRILESRG